MSVAQVEIVEEARTQSRSGNGTEAVDLANRSGRSTGTLDGPQHKQGKDGNGAQKREQKKTS